MLGYAVRSYGTVFRVTKTGKLTTVVSLTAANGTDPGGLVMAKDGSLYGLTSSGGPGGGGTIFRLLISEFTSFARQQDGSFLLGGIGPSNRAFRLWASPNAALPLTFWTLLTSNLFDIQGRFTYSDRGAATNNSHFYRISVP
jgi:uncharacterized repeat protein (TIGR03803 family)